MSVDWEKKQLSDVVELIIDNRGRNPKSYATEGIPVIDNFLITSDGEANLGIVKRFIDEETYNSFLRKHIQKDDVLMTLVGNGYGKVATTPIERCAIIQNTIGLRCNKNNNNQFLYYLLKSNRESLINLNRGAAQPSIKVGDVLNLEFKFPPIEKQKRIASILVSLDKKIELNRQTNQTLEQIAQAIFKSWFVDFEPVKAKIIIKEKGGNALAQSLAAQAIICGAITLDELEKLEEHYPGLEHVLHPLVTNKFPEQTGLDFWQPEALKNTAALFPDALVESELGEVPEGWEITELGKILEFNPKRTLKKGTLAPYLDMKNVPTQGHLADDVYMREMASGTKFINGDTLLARITPCLENGKTAYVDFLDNEQVAWGSTEYIVMRPKNNRPMSLGYIIARLDSFRFKAIQTMTGTSGRQRANAKALSDQSWVDYPTRLLNIYDLVAGSYLKKAKINGDENKILSELRDALLSKLLSGELNVGKEV
ncbi:MAG: restriction endonuclease subunit S [Woeseiaceae bacterium]